jgi:hypothetical protein
MFIANVIIGLIFGAVGVAFILYAYPLNKKILFLSWVEQKYGQGTGSTAYKLLGLVLLFAGICAIIGWLDLAKPILGAFEGSPSQSSPSKANPEVRYNNNYRGGDIAP